MLLNVIVTAFVIFLRLKSEMFFFIIIFAQLICCKRLAIIHQFQNDFATFVKSCGFLLYCRNFTIIGLIK